MFFKVQHTIKNRVKAAGVGLHTGKMVSIEITPAPVDSGIYFIRKDISSDCIIPAKSKYVVDGRFASTIGAGDARVSTVEHLMAAFWAAGVDNACVEIDGPEVPAMDGSAAPFMALLQQAETQAQEKNSRYLKIVEDFSVEDGDKSITIRPSDCLKVDFTIDFPHPLIATQHYSRKISRKIFSREIARARTFGFLKEVELLRKNGLALGGSLDNAVVIGDKAILNHDGLRFPDEFVRHKVLDLLGDLYLSGLPLMAEITAVKSGHALHHRLVDELLSRPYLWRIVDPASENRGISSWVRPVEDMASQFLPV